MRILAIADEESKSFWEFFDKSKLQGVDLIISCGDLDPRYLSFLATFAAVPVLYVHGNHDKMYEKTPPEGCICIDDKIYVHDGVRIVGLGAGRFDALQQGTRSVYGMADEAKGGKTAFSIVSETGI